MKDERESQNRLLHAIDLALVCNWGDAKSLVETIENPIADRLFLLLAEIEEAEASRQGQLVRARHEIGNALSIAQANLEAIIDGVLEPTPDRLNALLAAIVSASRMLDSLRKAPETKADVARMESFNICGLIEAHVAAVARLAHAKGVSIDFSGCAAKETSCLTYHGDAAITGRLLRHALVSAVRHTPPEGVVEIGCGTDSGAIHLAVHGSNPQADMTLLGKLARTIGGTARLERDATVVIDLPLETA